MTHSGFDDEKAAKAHKDNWPLALDELDQKLTTSRSTFAINGEAI